MYAVFILKKRAPDSWCEAPPAAAHLEVSPSPTSFAILCIFDMTKVQFFLFLGGAETFGSASTCRADSYLTLQHQSGGKRSIDAGCAHKGGEMAAAN